MALVIDASVTLGWYFPDETNATAEAARRQFATDKAVAPVFGGTKSAMR